MLLVQRRFWRVGPSRKMARGPAARGAKIFGKTLYNISSRVFCSRIRIQCRWRDGHVVVVRGDMVGGAGGVRRRKAARGGRRSPADDGRRRRRRPVAAAVSSRAHQIQVCPIADRVAQRHLVRHHALHRRLRVVPDPRRIHIRINSPVQ